ncbi:cell division protein FtsK [Melittangium boletus]|uniref:Cell division protein FtsK n=1 Tax=Melittangium boletus DSM 14713 TaxID=1294270 RepID=A0A250IQV8_9BACT|nr:cell division protein FtsK [Melittangium boletus]ATB33642.1 cell division protein FtsK [Melittangium boletus DSM 14713]
MRRVQPDEPSRVMYPRPSRLLGLTAMTFLAASVGCGGPLDMERDEAMGRQEAALAETQWTVTLRTWSSHYLVADKGGGAALMAYSTAANEWETFTLTDVNGGSLVTGDVVTLRSISGQWGSALNGGGGEIRFTATAPQAWEQFTITKLNGGGNIVSGDQIALKTGVTGQFISAANAGGGTVTATGASAREWETLTLGISGSGGSSGGAGSILFVGNSFTHGHEEPVYSYNKGAITDANGSGQGGVPGIFKQLTVQAGLSYNVTIETVSGETLSGHYATKSAIIGRAWDTVVLQENSTRPLPTARGGSPADFFTGADNLRRLVLSKNASAKVYLYETWASPASVSAQGYTGGTAGLQAMQSDLRGAYFKASSEQGFTGVARVGDGFLRAIEQGLADPDPSNGITPGTFNLWSSSDSRHAGKYGSYLSAAVLFARITGADPRTLAVGTGSAAAGLGISSTDASNLNRIAYEITAQPLPLAPLPALGATFSGSVTAGTPANLTGGAQLTSLTTAEGTFTNLVGATANSITGTNTPNSRGSTPANANAAASGLGVNVGANNLGTGNFQFGTAFSAKTRFFIVESALTSGTIGDDTVVTLIDASNNQVGAFSLSLLASHFTASAAGNTSSALATINYTGGVASVTGSPAGTVQSKLGAVTFSLADLGVTTPANVGAARGIRLASSTLDPNAVGFYTVP